MGAVGPAEPEGMIPLTSETTEDSIGARPSGLLGTASDVGIATELGSGSTGVGEAAPVPSAVVMPMMMPPDDGITSRGWSLEGDAGTGVGSTMLLGKSPPVEAGCWLGVGSGLSNRDDRRPPIGP